MLYEYDIRATKKLWYSCIQDYNKYLQEDIGPTMLMTFVSRLSFLHKYWTEGLS